MTGVDFVAFREFMGHKMGLDAILSERKTAALFKCSRHQVRKWSAIGAPIYVAYACTAMSRGLTPWGQMSNKEKVQ